jgi:hypothetical protein
MLAEGDAAPDFTLPDRDGGTVKFKLATLSEGLRTNSAGLVTGSYTIRPFSSASYGSPPS